MSPISINNNWLYFSYKPSNTEPFVIKRFHLKTKQEEILTAPPFKAYGDYSLSISPDGSKLAFLRSVAGTKKELMLLNLHTSEVVSLTNILHIIFTITWKEDSENIIYVDKDNTLTEINISSFKKNKLFESSKYINSPVLISSNEILLSTGEFYQSNIKQISLNTLKQASHNIVSSSFNDFGASLHKKNNTKLIAFISNRSGTNQIWMYSNEKLSKKTDFNGTNLISDLSFSHNGKILLFIKNHQLFSLDIKSNEITLLTKNKTLVRNPIWACSSNNTILVSLLNEGIWSLNKVNITSNKIEKLLTSVNSVKGDCSNERYYITKSHESGVYQLSSDLNKFNQNTYLPDTHFIESYKWSVDSNVIYYLKGNYIYSFNIDSKTNKKLLPHETVSKGFYLIDNTIVFDTKSLNNTYIIKVKI